MKKEIYLKKLVLIILIGLLIGLTIFAVNSTDFKFDRHIEITDRYIVNDHWDGKYNNAIRIDKMIVLDDRMDVFSKGFIKNSMFWDFENTLAKDSSLSSSYWGQNTPEKPYMEGKVFFDKDNGWNWNLNGVESRTIGKLEKDTWYKFSSLTVNTKYYKYVYVDNTGKTHIFSVNKANY